ncbi:helix-turn-helix domain-containing protein [Marinobacterium lutimaris]|uniref:Transcriptional regulator, AraC family n=1 Tax=Marinobacterium lutimaris TaxID=568106 RepID=A0A1H6C0S8_9GAMM|nr:helix-turn-helix domain-containing protein [Marinobacterium lutimaris]SEG66579.1 transcriptional regulator, AraC family [Marinobacterium lutimaris]
MDNLIAAASAKGWVSTHDIPAVERRSFWLNQVNDRLIKVDCPSEEKTGINASLRHLDLDRLRLNQIRANTHSIQRSQADIAGDDRHSVFLCFMRGGDGFSYQGTQCVQHSPGDIILYDTRMPYGQGFPADMEMVVMDLPEIIARQYLRDWKRGDLLHLHRDTRFSDTSCAKLFELLDTLVAPSIDGGRQLSAADEMLENIGALISNICSGDRDLDFWRLCCRYIQQHLQDESLSSVRLAKELNTSTRRLHRTFADNGISVQNYIWKQRLEQCRKEIITPSLSNRSVSEIAFKWGFNDASHFSRRYKAHYGESPVETRKSMRDAV